jgi:endonuclease YncB( thermonuclease family)
MRSVLSEIIDGLPVVGLLLLLCIGAAYAQPTAVDGDTIRNGGVTYRLANIDAPETGHRARCESEDQLGRAAARRMQSLMGRADVVTITPTGRRDRYGRTLALVEVDGRDAGEILIREGLARPWRGRRESWCGDAQ